MKLNGQEIIWHKQERNKLLYKNSGKYALYYDIPKFVPK